MVKNCENCGKDCSIGAIGALATETNLMTLEAREEILMNLPDENKIRVLLAEQWVKDMALYGQIIEDPRLGPLFSCQIKRLCDIIL